MDPGLATVLFMGVIIKIPVVFACWLLWYAFHAEPEPAEAPEGEDGGHGFRRFDPERPKPHGPRRGPHAPDALPLPDCPPGGRTHPSPSRGPVLAPAGHDRSHERTRTRAPQG